MLTGTRLFEGATISATLASVLKTEPDWTALPAQTPAAICRLLRRCLEKDRKHRLSDAADARLEIDDALSGAASESVAAPAAAIVRPSMWRRVLPIAAAAVFGGLVGGGGVWALLQPRPPAVQRVTVTPTGEVGDSSRAPDVTISPNGRHIVYALGQSFEGAQLFVRSLDQLEATPLRSGFAPFVSPDSAWIGYADRNGLRKVRITGGPPVTICTTPEMGSTVNGASWGSNDTIVFGTVGGGLFRVAAGGGTPEALTRPDTSKGEAGHVLPEVLPGGRAVLFTIVPSDDLGERNQIAVLNLETRQTKILIHEGSTPRYASSGHLVYAAEGSLRAVPFDVGRLEVRGNPVPVAEHIATKRASAGAAASFGLAQDGTLIYRTGDVQSGANRVLVWVDRQGHEEPIGAPVRTYFYPRLSPDGARIALDIRDQGMDIWVWEFARHSLTQLTFDPGLNREGVWNPDGKRIAFSAQRDGFENLYWEAADGTGTAERLTDRPKTQLPLSFTPDGMRFLFSESANSNPPYDIGVVNLTGISARSCCCMARKANPTQRFLRTAGGSRISRTNPSNRKSTCVRFPTSIVVAGWCPPAEARALRGPETGASSFTTRTQERFWRCQFQQDRRSCPARHRSLSTDGTWHRRRTVRTTCRSMASGS